MSHEYRIAALWMEGPLSWLDQLCLVSFRDAGHHVTLYHYGPVPNIPEGIEAADAAQILPRTGFLQHERTGSPALHSDLFRYHLLAKCDRTIWADTDAYCRAPFRTQTGHFFGWESDHHINGGVLGLPQDSEALGRLLEFTADEFAIPPWFDADERARLEALRDAGSPVHAGEMPWGVWGPHALTHFLHETGEAKYALPRAALYPISFKERRNMLKPGMDLSRWIRPETVSIHFYGRRMRKRLVEKEGGRPHPDSLIGQLVARHGIDIDAAPLPGLQPRPAAARGETARPGSRDSRATPDRPAAPEGWRTLTDLADGLGLDRGSQKHRFTELYEMLLRPLRGRKLRLVELGQGEDAEISAAMWLDYFRKAEIVSLAARPVGAWHDARLRRIACDMGDRIALARAGEEIGQVDIVIDDASHASHHQQLALAELFPRLNPGGLYIVEDLRWQPAEMETMGWPKTAELFRAYQQTGRFSHPDPGIESTLNRLARDMQGVFVFPAHYRKDRRDQVLVIHKR